MTGLSRCGRQYPIRGDLFKLASDGRYWPAGFLDGDNGMPGCGWLCSWPTCDGGWNDQPNVL